MLRQHTGAHGQCSTMQAHNEKQNTHTCTSLTCKGSRFCRFPVSPNQVSRGAICQNGIKDHTKYSPCTFYPLKAYSGTAKQLPTRNGIKLRPAYLVHNITTVQSRTVTPQGTFLFVFSYTFSFIQPWRLLNEAWTYLQIGATQTHSLLRAHGAARCKTCVNFIKEPKLLTFTSCIQQRSA